MGLIFKVLWYILALYKGKTQCRLFAPIIRKKNYFVIDLESIIMQFVGHNSKTKHSISLLLITASCR